MWNLLRCDCFRVLSCTIFITWSIERAGGETGQRKKSTPWIQPRGPGTGVGVRGGGEDVQFQCLCSSLCTIVNSLDFDPADRSQMYITSSLLDHFTGFASCSCFATKESTKCVISAQVNMILLPKWCFPDAWNALTPKMFWFLFF